MDKFKEIQNTHLALTQYHRWYQVYEAPFNKLRIENQKDILADDVQVEGPTGISKGKENLEDRLKVFDGWQNAHHVKHTTVKQLDDNHLSLEADILYQNIRPDNSRYSYTIHYSNILRLRENNLPQFVSVKILPAGTIENPEFTSAYAENRAKSFMHYWLYCMGALNGDATFFKELLSEKFELYLSPNELTDTFEKFKSRIAELPKQVKMSGYVPKNFQCKLNHDQTIAVTADIEWQGISLDNKEMKSETHHEWALENNLNERFARMKQMRVTQKQPA